MDFVPRRDFEIEGILYPKGIFYLEGILSKGILWRRDFVRRDFEIEPGRILLLRRLRDLK